MLLTEIPHGADSARQLEGHLSGALRLALGTGTRARGGTRDLERTLFIVTQLVESLAHAAVLRRPPKLSFAAAKAEAVRAILAYLDS